VGTLLFHTVHTHRLAQHLDQLVGDKGPMFVAHDLDGALIVGQGVVKSQFLLSQSQLRAVPKTIILTQVINHATEHREQVKTILTQSGIEPPDLQSWAYYVALDGQE
jgi:hypothetical protein